MKKTMRRVKVRKKRVIKCYDPAPGLPVKFVTKRVLRKMVGVAERSDLYDGHGKISGHKEEGELYATFTFKVKR